MMTLAVMLSTTVMAKGYKITGKLTGNVEGKTIYLCKSGTDEQTKYRPVVLDSTIIRNGQFVFKGKLAEPSLLLLKYFPNDNRGEQENGRLAMRPVLPLFMGNEKVNVEGNVNDWQEDFLTAVYDTYNYKNTQISGSALNDLYREYKQGRTDYTERRSQLSDAFHSKYYDKNNVTPMAYVVKELARQDSAKAATCAFLKDFIMRNSDNLAGVVALDESLGTFDNPTIESLVAAISDKMKATTQGQTMLEHANVIKRTAQGATFADVTLMDADGRDHQLSEYLGKGNYTLLEFWASWCGPCRGSIPHLKQLYGLYHPQGFDIVSVSMDTDNKAWHKALGEEQMKWTQLICKDGFGQVAKTYNFNGIPYCVLIGPKGEIVETNCRDARLDRRVVDIYGNKLESLHIVADIDTQKDSLTLITVPFGSSTMESKKYPVSNGHLDLTLPLESPVQMSIMEPGNYMAGISFPGMPGEEVVVKGSIRDHTISGSNFYTDYAEVQRQLAPYTKQLTEKRVEIEQLWTDLGLRDNTVKGKQKVKNQKIYDEAKEKYVAEAQRIRTQLNDDIISYIKNHPRQEAAVTLLASVPADSLETLAKGINYFVANGRMKPAIDALKKQAENEQMRKAAKDAIKEGVQAPDFTLDDINGKPLTLSSLRGKWVILDFWGSWCGWCIKGMPAMKEYYKKYSGKFEIIGVDCRDTVGKWKKAVKDNELPWLHVYNKAADGTPEKYAVEGYPTKIIINPDGTINKIIVGESQDFYNYLDELLK
jgi:thiol-disulfide isomerase/thioredoxin